MKKLTAIILALLTVITMVSFSASAAVDSPTVARMWICSAINDNTGIGHIYLYFENLTGQTITVGRYQIAAYGDVSVGSFGTEGPRGGGVYYNNETYLTHYGQLMGLSTDLDEGELQAVNNKIRNYNRWDPLLFNCNYFALTGWNAGSDSDIPFLIFPGLTRYFIRLKGGIANPYEPYSRTDPVIKQNEL